MGLSPSGNFFCYRTDVAVRGIDGLLMLVDDCLVNVVDTGDLKARL